MESDRRNPKTKSESESESGNQILHKDILLEIFKYLSFPAELAKIKRVNKQWKALAETLINKKIIENPREIIQLFFDIREPEKNYSLRQFLRQQSAYQTLLDKVQKNSEDLSIDQAILFLILRDPKDKDLFTQISFKNLLEKKNADEEIKALVNIYASFMHYLSFSKNLPVFFKPSEQQEHPLYTNLLNLSGLDLSNFIAPSLFSLSYVDLTNADLTNASFRDVNFKGANLTRADLSGAYLTHANLSYANLQNANITGTDFSNAEFTRTVFLAPFLTGDNTQTKINKLNKELDFWHNQIKDHKQESLLLDAILANLLLNVPKLDIIQGLECLKAAREHPILEKERQIQKDQASLKAHILGEVKKQSKSELLDNEINKLQKEINKNRLANIIPFFSDQAFENVLKFEEELNFLHQSIQNEGEKQKSALRKAIREIILDKVNHIESKRVALQFLETARDHAIFQPQAMSQEIASKGIQKASGLTQRLFGKSINIPTIAVSKSQQAFDKEIKILKDKLESEGFSLKEKKKDFNL